MDRRGLLRGAAAAAATGVLLPATRAQASALATDYPFAHWRPASTTNYSASDRRAAHIRYVVIHVAQASFASAVRTFQNPMSRVSAHYVVRSADGRVVQCVRECSIGWHAGNWHYNIRSIGIEHEGWVDRPGYFTHAMYKRSAALTASICDRYGIPKDRAHIIGHNEVPGAHHTDPGPLWDWGRYMWLVNFA
jgi:N-acetyl-anhydromuramyl-L-alanine amidase AmpD